MSHVFHRSNLAKYPVAVKGEGIYITDSNGKRYLDGCCGAAVSCLGHSNADVKNAMKNQIDKLAWAHSGFFTTEPMEELADFLIERAPEGIERVYFVSGGSEAIEAGIKLARQYYLETKRPEKKYVIARLQSYHGNTIGALSAGGNQWRRIPYEPILVDMKHISPCYEYRGKKDGESSFEYGQRVANELEAQILELGADNVMCFIAEPVVGATLGGVSVTTESSTLAATDPIKLTNTSVDNTMRNRNSFALNGIEGEKNFWSKNIKVKVITPCLAWC